MACAKVTQVKGALLPPGQLIGCVAALALLSACAGDGDLVTFTNANQARPETIEAYLSKPEGPGPFPAVMLFHGCTGLGKAKNGASWRGANRHAAVLRSAGFVSLIVDSHGSRGIGLPEAWVTSCIEGKGFTERTDDAFGALDFLEGLPYVARGKVAAVGFSQGGAVVMRLLGGYQGRTRGQRFAAGVAYYPACSGWAVGNATAYHVPLLIFMGSKDKGADSCRFRVEEAKRRADYEGGILPELVIYEGAYHAFDMPVRVQGTPIGMVASDPGALRDSQRRMVEFLKKHFEGLGPHTEEVD